MRVKLKRKKEDDMSDRKLKECGNQKPYSFLLKYRLKGNHYIWTKQKLKQEKKFLDHLFQEVDPKIVLDRTQRKIIVCEEDHQFIIAGAGSGKTTTLVAKIIYMIQRRQVLEDEILVITYTNQAVFELKKRLQVEFKKMVKVVTIHKFCYDVIKQYDQDYYVCEDTTEIFLDALLHWKQTYPELYQSVFQNYYEKFIVPPTHPNSFLRFCQKFIFLFLELGNEINTFQLLLEEYKGQKKIVTLLQSMRYIYEAYISILKQNDLITFPQMISFAQGLIKQKVDRFPQKYIFVDEFQDISYSRYQLLQILVEKFKVHLICVGDDFQSIYSFAGSNIELFLQHSKKFSNMKTFFITATYRNSHELIGTAGHFIMKNKAQIKKKLISHKHEKKPIVLWEYQDNYERRICAILDMITMDSSKKEILLLGRYHFDLDVLLKTNVIKKEGDKLYSPSFPQLNFYFYTVHQSKGLGFDEVILLNAQNGYYGFPSEVILDEIDMILKKETVQSKLEEERRLFYVALTRTKNRIHILYPKYRASSFVKEIEKEAYVEQRKL